MECARLHSTQPGPLHIFRPSISRGTAFPIPQAKKWRGFFRHRRDRSLPSGGQPSSQRPVPHHRGDPPVKRGHPRLGECRTHFNCCRGSSPLPTSLLPVCREQGAARSSPDVLNCPTGRATAAGRRAPPEAERNLPSPTDTAAAAPSPPTSPPTVGSIDPPLSSASLAGRALYLSQTKRGTDPPIEKGAIPPEFGEISRRLLAPKNAKPAADWGSSSFLPHRAAPPI